MAVKGDITASVGINVEKGGLDSVASQLETRITQAIQNLEKIGDVAAKVGSKVTKAQQKEINQLDGTIKGLGKNLQALQTVLNSQNRGTKNNINSVLGSDLSDQRLARNIKAISEYRRSLEDSSSAAEKLRSRINGIDKETASLAKTGQLQSTQRLAQQEKLNKALQDYERFSSTLAQQQGKIGMLSPASQKQMESLVLEAQNLKRVFTDLASDNRRFNFDFLVNAQKSITAEIDKQIGLLKQEEKLEERLGVNARARAQALLDVTSRERQISLESRSKSLAGRLTPTQIGFGNAVGEEAVANRLARVTSALNVARNRLAEATSKSSTASTEQVAKLTGQYERLDKKLVETIALQGRMAQEAAKPIATPKPTAENQSPFSKAFNGLLGDGGLGLASRVGIYATAASAVYSLINAVKDGAKFVVEFEDKLATLQAISSSTDEQMKALSASILNVSTSSRFSAVEIAEATVQLAQAGFSAGDTTKALESVVQFAAASGTGVKESVDLMTGALGAFQLQASETSRISDVMVAALNKSKLTSQQIAQAIQYVGTTAFEQNINLEQLVATIGSVAQAGVRSGSTLGTGFRQFLVDLTNPTEKLKEQLDRLGISMSDIDVKTQGFNKVLQNLKDAGFGAQQAYEGLEVRAAAFYLTAKNNIDVSQQLLLAESQRGVAALANERAMNSLNAQWQRFQNILGQIANDSAPLEFLTGLTRAASDAAENYRNLSKAIDEVKEKSKEGNYGDEDGLTKVNIVLYQLTEKFKETIPMFGDLYKATKQSQEAFAEYNAAVSGSSPELDKIQTAVNEANDAFNTQAQTVASVDKEFDRLLLQGPAIRGDTIQTAIETNNLTSRFEGLAAMLGTSANGYDNLIAAMRRYRTEQLALLGTKASAQENASRTAFSDLTSRGNAQIRGIRDSAEYQRLSPQLKSQLSGLITSAQRGDPGATSALNDFAGRLRRSGQGLDALDTRVRQLSNTLGSRSATRAEGLAAVRTGEDIRVQTDRKFVAINDNLATIRASIGQKLATASELSPKERAAAFGTDLKNLDNTIGTLNGLLKTNQGKPAVVRNLQGLLAEATSQRNQVVGLTKPTKAEDRESAKAQRKAEAAATKAQREAERAQNKFNANELSASQATLKAADRSLSAYVNGPGIGLKLATIGEFFDKGDEALEKWVEARRDVLQDAITKAGMTPAQIAEMTAAANEEIAAKQKSTYQKQVESLSRAINTYLEQQGRAIERLYSEANYDLNRSVGIQSGLRTGLDNPLTSQGIPSYTRVLQQRRVDIAQDQLKRNQAGTMNADGSFTGGANEDRIKQYEADIDKITEALNTYQSKVDEAQSVIDGLNAKKAAGIELSKEEAQVLVDTEEKVRAYSTESRNLGTTLTDQRNKVDELRLANEQLRAEYAAVSLAPKNFADALGQAASAWRIMNGEGLTLNQRLFNGLGDVLDSAHQSFQTFFTDVATGAKSVGQAFGDMAKAVVSAILEMAAKAVATQIFGLLLSFIPSVGGPMAMNTLAGGPAPLPSVVPRWNGGKIGNETPQRLIGGGAVSQGLPTRDSALVYAAKGEFMMRRSSVESIGHDILNDMNNRGAQALNGFGNKNVVVPQSRVDSNVYVMLPEEQPQLGPNDVIAIINRDVLRGGSTKQLIKQVSAGG